MQLLVRNDVKDFDTWKTEFDNGHEGLMNAGLGVLQIWREAGNSGRVWYLLDVNDSDKARAYMDGDHARLLNDRAGVTDGEYHFVETL